MKCRQSHRSINYRILIAFLKNVAGLWAFFASFYWKPFEASRPYVAIGVVGFFLVSAWSTWAYYSGFLKTLAYEGTWDNIYVEIESKLLLPEPQYELTLHFRPAKEPKKMMQEVKLVFSFNEWINTTGVVDYAEFEKGVQPKLKAELKLK